MSKKKVIAPVKCVVVGDGAVGKTCMVVTYVKKEFPKEYVPTVFENTVITIFHQEKNVQMCIWDTAGQEDYDQLRILNYPGADVFIVTFAIDDKTSLANVKAKWHKELRKFSKKVPYILCACKIDMVGDNPDRIALSERAKEMAKGLKADGYFECSAKENEGLEEVFQAACRVGISKRGKGGCTVM